MCETRLLGFSVIMIGKVCRKTPTDCGRSARCLAQGRHSPEPRDVPALSAYAYQKASWLVPAVLLPRRWVVERTFAWLNRNRRLAKDVEATIESATGWVYIASVKLMSRRLARI